MQDNRMHDNTVTRLEEELRVETRPVVTGRLRVTRRVVTEERTITVRREELVVEEIPADERELDTSASLTGNAAKDAAIEASRVHRPRGEGRDEPVIDMVLHEEQVVTTVVPVERVRVYIDRVAGERVVEADLAKEVVTLEREDARTDERR